MLSRIRPAAADRWFTPVGVVVIVLLANVAAARMRPTDTLTAAQDSRLTFQVGGPVGRLTPRAGIQGKPDPLVTRVVAELPDRRPGRVSILYIGNSQTMAIMDQRPGDRIGAAWLSAALNGGETDAPYVVRLGSEANLTMAELLIKTVAATRDETRRPDAVVVGIVLDGLRWVEPRGDLVKLVDSQDARRAIAHAVGAAPPLAAATRALESVLLPKTREDASAAARVTGASGGGGIADLERRLQQRAEALLPLFAARLHLHSELNLRYTAARNTLLGFKTTTRRPIPPAMYATNLELIEASLRLLREQGIDAIFYIAPIRPLEPNPYVPADVERFRRDLAALCDRYGALHLDYARLIPERLWTDYPEGTKTGLDRQPDFAHFTGEAHRTLGERLAADMKQSLQLLAARR